MGDRHVELPALHANGCDLLDSEGASVQLRGANLGSWLSMDFYMHGLPGSFKMIRLMMEERAGKEKADAVFRCMEEAFITEQDISLLKKKGANVLWLPLHYRHFFEDTVPAKRIDRGFEMVAQVIQWCEKYEMYLIPELHSAPGGQNATWSSNESCGEALLFREKYYGDLAVKFWTEIAKLCSGKSVIAGYDLLHAPAPSDAYGKIPLEKKADGAKLWELYGQMIDAVRQVDPNRLLILEGDREAQSFFEAPKDLPDNIAFACTLKTKAASIPYYPGLDEAGTYWDAEKIQQEFLRSEAMRFCRKRKIPLFVKSFGTRGYSEITEAQLDAFEACGIHWVYDSYKDCGYRGLVRFSPNSPYWKLFGDMARRFGGAEGAPYGQPVTKNRQIMKEAFYAFEESMLKASGNQELGDPKNILSRWIDDVYYGKLLAFEYGERWKKMSFSELEEVIEDSFRLECCQIHPMMERISAYWKGEERTVARR